MKTLRFVLVLLPAAALPARAQESTLADNDAVLWAANTGWILPRHSSPAPNSGLRCTDGCLSGFVWSANCGWISFGDGTPAAGLRYANTDGADCGVNLDAAGNLSGLAWGANIGWINFGWAAPADPSRARIDLCTGEFLGFAWSANTGWIKLAGTGLRTESLQFTDADDDGLSDMWELDRTGTLTILSAGADKDGDGFTDADEFLADTDPLNAGDHFDLMATWQTRQLGTVFQHLRWTARPSRHYRILASPDLTPGSWQPAGPAVFKTTSGQPLTGSIPVPASAGRQFYKVEIIRPLAP